FDRKNNSLSSPQSLTKPSFSPKTHFLHGFKDLEMAAASARLSSPHPLTISVSSRPSPPPPSSTSLFFPTRSSTSSKLVVSASSRSDSSSNGLSEKAFRSPLSIDLKNIHGSNASYAQDDMNRENPPIMPEVPTPGGAVDLFSVLFRNRIIFIGEEIDSRVAQQVISQLVTLASIDEEADITIYLNSPGGNTYSVMAIYDCMSTIKPRVGTVGFGMVASQAAIILAGGEKGMRYSMPNSRVMLQQPHTGCGGPVKDVRRQVDEAVHLRQVNSLYLSLAVSNLSYKYRSPNKLK
ncbi:ATP-dependent Clp protease proteolytic subunit 6, chloroplastic, partial [Linum perenne]